MKLEPRQKCPDCQSNMFRSDNHTDGWWMCGKCDESKRQPTAIESLRSQGAAGNARGDVFGGAE